MGKGNIFKARMPSDALIAISYRCNSRCHMCSTWQYPSDPKEEIQPHDLLTLPHLKFCNITGGEPFLRDDIGDFVHILSGKAGRIVISTNGFFTERILKLAEQYPRLGFRISLEGLISANDELRGVKGCFEHALRSILELNKLGVKDIGFGITLSDRNILDLTELYQLSKMMKLEFATAAVHNSYYFHKHDNRITRHEDFDREFKKIIEDLLKSDRIKNWFRAYFNYGLLNYVHGRKRLLPCDMGRDVFFIDPFGEVMACNAMEASMGNIRRKSFREIWYSQQAEDVRKAVATCDKNCWMIGSAAPAIKKHIAVPLAWIVRNKLRMYLGKDIDLGELAKLKIAVLGTRGFPNVQGGIETHCENLYPQLVELGCDVTVLTRRPYVDPAVTNYKGVKLMAVPCLKNKYFETIFHTFIGLFAARRLRPDILHIHAVGPSLFVPLARLLGLKVVMTNHGPDYKRKKWGILARLILRSGEAAGSLCSNAVICISEHIASAIKKRYGKNPFVIPNSVHIPKPSHSDEAVRIFGLTKDKYVLAVGRLVPEKGFHDLLSAFKMADLPDWKLVIVGKADHESSYSIYLKAAAVDDDSVVLTGFLSGKFLQEIYTHAGMFVLPSYYEGLPIVLLEALSYGLTCIASDIPANMSFDMPPENYFPSGSSKELSRKIRQFSDAPMSSEARHEQIEKIRMKYDWSVIARRTLDVYESVVNVQTRA